MHNVFRPRATRIVEAFRRFMGELAAKAATLPPPDLQNRSSERSEGLHNYRQIHATGGQRRNPHGQTALLELISRCRAMLWGRV